MGLFSGVKDVFEAVISWFIDIPEPETGLEINRSERNAPLPIVYGTCLVEGANWVYWETSGKDRRYLWLWVALCEGEVDAIEQILIDDKPIQEFGDISVAEYPNQAPGTGDTVVVVNKYLGADDQIADQMLINETGGKWTTNHRNRGVCGLAMRLRYYDNKFSGVPKISAVIRGRKVLDPRTGTTAYSNNGVLCLLDYLTNTRFGKGLDWATDFDQAVWQAAMNDADVTENASSGGSLGTPDDTGTVGNRKYVQWWTKPAAATAIAGAQLTAAGKSATLNIGKLSPGWFGGLGGFFAWYEMITGIDFTTSDTISVDLSTFSMFQLNIVLNGGNEPATMWDNVKKMRAVIRGDLALLGDGKYHLYLEKDRAPVFNITQDHILGGFSWTAPSKGDKFNRVTVKFQNPNIDWKDDMAIFPEPGSATETTLLAEDGNLPLYHEVTLEGVKNKYQAAELARIILYKSRNNIQCEFVGAPELLEYHCGQVVTLTHPGPGWNQKEFMITKRGLADDGSVTMNLTEFNDSIYTYQAIPDDLLKDNTTHDDPFDVETPTGLAGASIVDILDGGHRRFGLTVTFTEVDDESIDFYEVQYRRNGTTKWLTTPPIREDQTEIFGLKWAQTYNLRIRAVNDIGIASPWSSAVNATVNQDTTAPSNPTVNSVTGIIGGVRVSITAPSEADTREVQIFYDTTTIPGTPQFSLPCTPGQTIEFEITALAASTVYRVWARAVDDSGNVSGNNASVSGTTLADPIADAAAAQATADTANEEAQSAGSGFIADPTFQKKYDVGGATDDRYWTTPTGSQVGASSGEDGGAAMDITTLVSAYVIPEPTMPDGSDFIFYPVQPSAKIKVRCRIYVATGYDTSLYVQLTTYDKDKLPIAFPFGAQWNGTTFDSWHTIEGTTTLSSAARFIRIRLVSGNTSAGGQTAKWGSVQAWDLSGALAAQDSVAGGGSGDIDSNAIGTNELDGSSSGAFNQEIIMAQSGQLHTLGKDDFGDVTAGIWFGYSGGAYKLDIGDINKFFKWDGASLNISDVQINDASGAFGPSIAVGQSALENEDGTTGYNVAIGPFALQDVTDGTQNTALGYGAGANLTTGDRNTILGYLAGGDSFGANDSGTIAIGHAAGGAGGGAGNILIGGGYTTITTYTNEIWVDNSILEANPLIWGELDNDNLVFNADVDVRNDSANSGGTLYVEGAGHFVSSLRVDGNLDCRSTADIDGAVGIHGILTLDLSGASLIMGSVGQHRNAEFGYVGIWQVQNAAGTWHSYVAGVAGAQTTIYYNNSSIFQSFADGIEPASDNLYDCGSSSNRWDNIRATNATIVTSDERRKTDIAEIDPALAVQLVELIEWVRYKWKDYETTPEMVEMPEAVMETILEPKEFWEDDGAGGLRRVVRMVDVEVQAVDVVPVTDEHGNLITKERNAYIPESMLPDGVELQCALTGKRRQIVWDEPVLREFPRMVMTQVPSEQKVVKKFTRHHWGVIAQQFKNVIMSLGLNPDDVAALIYDEKPDLYGMRYSELIPILGSALKETRRELQALEERLAAIEATR